MNTKPKSIKTRMNARIPKELYKWVQDYAEKGHTNVTQLIVDFFMDLRKKAETDHVPQL